MTVSTSCLAVVVLRIMPHRPAGSGAGCVVGRRLERLAISCDVRQLRRRGVGRAGDAEAWSVGKHVASHVEGEPRTGVLAQLATVVNSSCCSCRPADGGVRWHVGVCRLMPGVDVGIMLIRNPSLMFCAQRGSRSLGPGAEFM
jgi:hypothetical protein